MRLTVRLIPGDLTMTNTKPSNAHIEVMQIDDHKVVMKFPTASKPDVVSNVKRILFGQNITQLSPRKFDRK